CTRFTAKVGVDSYLDTLGSVVFQVLLDGTKVFDSGLMRGNTQSKQVSVDLTGKQELALIATNGGDGADADWADWADAFITCTGTGGTTPLTVTTTVPAASA